ncbi:MAG: hypothetical protein AMXMBFR83_28040 [Phycisphaerae bacterium]
MRRTGFNLIAVVIAGGWLAGASATADQASNDKRPGTQPAKTSRGESGHSAHPDPGGVHAAAAHADHAGSPATRPTSGDSRLVPSTQPVGLHAFKMKDIDGKTCDLAGYKGKVVLVVNVASKCGFTKQYAGLQKLYEDYKDKGLVVLGVPSNDFGQQEPGTESEIKEFCTSRYHVTFPMLAKVSVKNGPQQTALYKYLSEKARNGVLDAKVAWNFNKFLVGKDGKVIRHYESKVAPEDEKLRADIEKALKSSAGLPQPGIH